MASFPPLSPSAIFAWTPSGTGVVYDLLSETLFMINATAAAVCDACVDEAPYARTISSWANQTGVTSASIDADVDAALADFAARGWIGGSETRRTYLPDAPVTRLQSGETETTRAAGVHRIRFRSSDPSLVDDVVTVLGLPVADDRPTADFHLTPRDDGGVSLQTDSEWPFPDRRELRERIIAIVNDFVARTTTDVVLHAAAAQAPDGKVVVLPSPPGSGKSTLVAGLAQRGWTYLGDESATIRSRDLSVVPYPKPLDLDSTSLSALRLDPTGHPTTKARDLGESVRVGTLPTPPPSAIVLCTYVGDTGQPALDTLACDEALVELVRNTLNLRYVGAPGLQTLVALANEIPVHRISYRSNAEAVHWLNELGIG